LRVLTKLRLVLDVSLIFRENKVGLEHVLLRDKTMDSSGLRTLKQTFCSLPRLPSVEIIPHHRNCFSMVRSVTQEEDLFLRWAYTDERRLWLWLIAREELQRITLRQPRRVVVQFPEDLPDGMSSIHWKEGGYDVVHEAWLHAKCEVRAGNYEKWLGE
jgi:hypothetical protein